MNSEQSADLVTLTDLMRSGRTADLGKGASLSCSAHLLDGCLVHATALEAGLGTWLFPGQALLIKGQSGGFGELSFAHGVPQQAHLSMATMVQDNRIRRALLESRGISVPKGASFSVGKGIPGALNFAERIGYPVVVKPVIGESTIETMTHLRDRKELLQAIKYFDTAPNYREGFVAASYAFTALHTPKEEGSEKARPNYRILIERQMSGEYLRLLVVGGAVVSAIHAPHGPWRVDEDGRDILAEIHPSFKEFALEVWRVFPGLPVLAIDIVASNNYLQSVYDQVSTVVEVSERPWLHVQHHFGRSVSGSIARSILDTAAAMSDFSLPRTAQPVISVNVEWQGISNMSSFIVQMERVYHGLGVDASIQAADAVGGTAIGTLAGDAFSIALVSELAVAGEFPGERVMALEITPSNN